MRNRECIKKPTTRIGGTFSEKDNYARISFPPENNARLTWFFYDNGRWVSMETTANSTKTEDSGTWECNGNENFKIIAAGYVYTSDIGDWVQLPTEPEESPQPVGDNSVFDCILKNKNLQGDVAKVDPTGNFASFMVDEPNKVSHIFYKDKKWIQSKDGVTQFTGKWYCDGDHHFTIFTDDEGYSSRSNNWGQIESDTFPLKFGKKGSNIVKLQKFLNSKLPSNPLTINGIFDTETENKLIQYQRQEKLIP